MQNPYTVQTAAALLTIAQGPPPLGTAAVITRNALSSLAVTWQRIQPSPVVASPVTVASAVLGERKPMAAGGAQSSVDSSNSAAQGSWL